MTVTMPRVLMIATPPLWLRLLSLSCSRMGYDVITASDTEEALTMFHQETCHLVVLDETSPAESDPIYRALQQASVPLLHLVNPGEQDQLGRNEQGERRLAKPFTWRELSSHLQQALLDRTIDGYA